MNIFVLDTNPKLAAQYHCNKHCIKMILESCQLLSTAHHVLGNGGPLRKTHVNHRCAQWVRQSTENYDWLYQLAKELCIEYTYRYNKHHVYETNGVLDTLQHHPFLLPRGSLTTFSQAMPEKYNSSNAVLAYRMYYVHDKSDILQYKNREIPSWVNDYNLDFQHNT